MKTHPIQALESFEFTKKLKKESLELIQKTVSRILKKFETQQAIKLSRNKLTLLNSKILRSI